MFSRIALFGLPHEVDIVRKADGDDGAGGTIPGVETSVYASRKCRITTLDAEDEQQMFGEATGLKWKILLEYSPNLQRSDFIKVPFGTFPNQHAPLGTGDGWPWTLNITTPGGAKVLEWSVDNSRFQDSAEEYTLHWNGTAWEFNDTIAPLTHTFTGHLQEHTIFKLDWTSEVGAGYSVDSYTGTTRSYRVLFEKDQLDHEGGHHHTSAVMEYEDVDG